jgi:hypothetical protein
MKTLEVTLNQDVRNEIKRQNQFNATRVSPNMVAKQKADAKAETEVNLPRSVSVPVTKPTATTTRTITSNVISDKSVKAQAIIAKTKAKNAAIVDIKEDAPVFTPKSVNVPVTKPTVTKPVTKKAPAKPTTTRMAECAKCMASIKGSATMMQIAEVADAKYVKAGGTSNLKQSKHIIEVLLNASIEWGIVSKDKAGNLSNPKTIQALIRLHAQINNGLGFATP